MGTSRASEKKQVNIKGLIEGLVTDGVSVHHVLNQPAEEAWRGAGAPGGDGARCRAGACGDLIRESLAVRPQRPVGAPRRSAAVAAGPRWPEAGSARALRAPPAAPRQPSPRSLRRSDAPPRHTLRSRPPTAHHGY